MGNILDISKCNLYRLRTDEKILVAISEDYEKQVQQFISEYGSLEKVPASKTVRGAFIEKNRSGELRIMTGGAQENDITVNQLEKVS